ncbi:hypothetical protein OKW76_03975 [Sphingomonas sp. S1-29]|uniref:hypothetical protein n=1 Tax=Sphingomonas sp. S1-29 TaxID=2991074 RepID=UPI00223F269E|nr:hypothetical protein [Sphingomonas sp. S1-29]UZK70221.1 hypothetical protein OKW76_03975 [Sphingomonas sp. S1-29]
MSIRILCAAGSMLGCVAVPAMAQERQRTVNVSPYIQVGQVLTADLRDGDVLTYSTVSAGVDATVNTRRVQVQASYQYEHRFSWDDDIGDDDIHSGIARAAIALAPGLSLEAGALATRTRSDIRGAAPGILAGNVANISQLYSAYAGPTYANNFGDLGVNAAYRIGYTKVETPTFGTGLLPGEPALDLYDDSLNHLVTGSIGTRPGTVLPVGLTLSGAYTREDAGQLDQRYEGYFGRVEALLPVSRTLALTAGVGYESIESGQRDPLRNANGTPVLDGNGRFVTDESSPRRLGYDIAGIFYDAGVLWRPSPRTSVQFRVGERYGSLSFTGTASHQMSANEGIQVNIYDSVQTFGRQLTDGLAALPTSFNTPFDGFGDQYNGCIFGTQGGAVGGCLNNVFQSISTATFRARGIDAVYAGSFGATRLGAGAGYTNRRFFAADPGPDAGFTIDGLNDQSYYLQTFAARALGPNSGVTADIYVNYFDSGVGLGTDIWGAGATAAYFRQIGRLNAVVTGGIYTFDQEGGGQSDVSAQGLLGLGYRF